MARRQEQMPTVCSLSGVMLIQNPHTRHDLLWAGLHPAIRARVKPQATGENGEFRSITELIDKAADN